MSIFSSTDSLLKIREQVQPTLSSENKEKIDRMITKFLRKDPFRIPVHKKQMLLKRKYEKAEGSNAVEKIKKGRIGDGFSNEQIAFHPIKNRLKRQAEESGSASESKKARRKVDEKDGSEIDALIAQFSQMSWSTEEKKSDEIIS